MLPPVLRSKTLQSNVGHVQRVSWLARERGGNVLNTMQQWYILHVLPEVVLLQILSMDQLEYLVVNISVYQQWHDPTPCDSEFGATF